MNTSAVLIPAAQLLALRPASTMDDIASAVGLSRATLFRKYPSREALVAEVSRLAVESYIEAVESCEPRSGPPEEALRRLAASLAALAPEFGLIVLQPLPEGVESEILLSARDADDEIRALIRRGQESGEFRVDLPAEWVSQALTWLIVGAADGLRTGILAQADITRLVSETIVAAVRRGQS